MKPPIIVVGKRSLGMLPLVAGIAMLLLVVGFGMYDLGLRKAGFNRLQSSALVGELRSELKTQRRANRELREQVVALETAAKIDRAAYARIEGELAELQNRILEQQEDIEFYAGIVNEGTDPGLRVQDFRIVPGASSQDIEVRIVLAQAIRGNKQALGRFELILHGLRRNEVHSLPLVELWPDGEPMPALTYGFRYFQELRLPLVLPPDFVPERIQLTLRPDAPDAQSVDEFFVWRLEES